MLEFSVDKKVDKYGNLTEIDLTTLDDDCFNINSDIIKMFDDNGLFIDNYLDCFAQAFCARQLVAHSYKMVIKFELYAKLVSRAIINCLLANKYPEEVFDEATYDDYLLQFIKNDDDQKLRRYRLFIPSNK